MLKRLPPKIIEIDGDGPRVADADEVGGGDEGRGPRIERVRASLRAATFTGKGDDKVVVGLYNDYIVKISNAMNSSGEDVERVYEGEYNAAGEAREGYGTVRLANGDVRRMREGKVSRRGAARIVLDRRWSVYEGGARHILEGRESPVGRGARHVSCCQRRRCTRESSRRISKRGAARIVLPTPRRTREVGAAAALCQRRGEGAKAGNGMGEGVQVERQRPAAWRMRDGEAVEGDLARGGASQGRGTLGLPLPEIGEYEGERNAEGPRQGRGTYRFANGGVYEGEYKGI